MQKLIICLLIVFAFPIAALAHGGVNDDELIIRMTKNGFEPRELTVTEGDEVLFINNDDANRWPASNFHPTHTLYPEFDPLKGIPPGSSWKMTFTHVGTWRMHDHLFPHMTGTIVVLADRDKAKTENASTTVQSANEEINSGFFTKIKTFLENFWQKISRSSNESEVSTTTVDDKLLAEFKSQDERAKYAWLENIAKEESPEIAWRYVKAAYDTPAGVVGNPHDMAHLVGQLLYKKYGLDGLSFCEPIFAFGCYHGLMEVAFDKDRNNMEEYQKNLLVAQSGCQKIGEETNPSYWSCIHGIGHGVATFRDYDTAKAMEDCDLLDERVRTYCHDGVFMEFSISAPPSFYNKANPIYPCDIVAQDYKSSCARSQVQVMRQRFKMATEDIAQTCLDSKNDKIIYHCVDAIGYFVGQSALGKSQNILSGCREIKDEKSAAQCIAAATGELVFQDYVGWQKTVKEVCGSLSGQFQTACSERVDQVKKSYGRN